MAAADHGARRRAGERPDVADVAASLGTLESAVLRRLAMLEEERLVAGIWSKDPTVWGGTPATPELANRLGWLDLPDSMAADVDGLESFAGEAAQVCRHLVLCGMGGSSLAPEVLGSAFGRRTGAPALRMLDSTHPDAIAAVDRDCDPEATLYVIASKSGTTIQTASFFQHFWRVTGGAGHRFVAVTDPGTPLAALATERGFRGAFLAPPDVGGRFSALSRFGLLPGAVVGVPVREILAGARAMAAECRSPGEANPGAWLGAVLAEAALAGRDKLTVLESAG